ncbi:replicative DNA helicase [Caloramator sp. E03]|uniref:replicative DNA helicase n=1 Tax=Caloramator sp. E03 TaxID=2576307 RepID=UPI001110DDB4|nr:replicative DNA helicase [Caloramator sp. E03]QCX33499.1 replicative DNA helicase [Caloramator sp. E03]
MEQKVLFNLQAEQAILGLILTKNEVIVEIDLKPEHFYIPKHQKLYAVMFKLFQEGKSIDIINIANEINVQEIGGHSYISDLAMHGDIFLDKNKIEIIKNNYYKRQLINTFTNVYKDIENKDYNILINELMQDIITFDDDKMDIWTAEKINKELFDVIDENMKQGGKIKGITCNISQLDLILNGFQNKKMYVIAGRPGMGKSALAINIADYVSKTKNVLYFSLEMTAIEIGLRILASQSLVDMAKIDIGRITPEEIKKLNNAQDRFSKQKLIVIDKAGLNINDIIRQAKKFKIKNMLDMVIVDHIGLVNADAETERQRVTNICIMLKNLAKDLDVPVIALSQLNRGVESRGDKRPALSDLKESSGIEENADVVLLLYRDEYYNANSKDKGIIEINISKNRGGRTGTIKLNWMGEFQIITGIHKVS